MARRSGFEYGELKKFAEKLQELADGVAKEFSQKCATQLAGRVYRRAVKRTPERTGTLRKGWKISAPSRHGNTVTVTVSNSVEYAPYVEYGHRIVVGGKISEGGKVIGFRPGHFMLTRSTELVRNIADKVVEEQLQKFLGKAFKK